MDEGQKDTHYNRVRRITSRECSPNTLSSNVAHSVTKCA